MPTCILTTDRRHTSVRRFFNRLLPKSMRSEAVTIPVIRLHGTIMSGGGQFRPTLSLASTAGLIEKAFAYPDAPGGRDLHQFAGRLAGAVAADLQAHPRPRGREEQDGAGLRRGCRGVRRLHDRGRRRRDHRRPLLDRRLDRRGFGLLRLHRADEEDRRRAPRLYRRQEQGGARPVQAGKQGRRRAAEGACSSRCTRPSSTSSRSGAATS